MSGANRSIRGPYTSAAVSERVAYLKEKEEENKRNSNSVYRRIRVAIKVLR